MSRDRLQDRRVYIVGSDGEGLGELVFDALIRRMDDQSDRGESILRDRIVQRLAYGIDESAALSEVDSIFERAIEVVAEDCPVDDQSAAFQAISAVASVVNRAVSSSSLGKAGRERAALMREEVTQQRLQDGLDKLAAEIGSLESKPIR